MTNSVSNISVALAGLTPTISFNTKYAAKVGVQIWEKGEVGQDLAAFGVGAKGTVHHVKPFLLASVIEPHKEYVYEI
ncbi:hypothetical protein CMK11_12300, partial [Candidatus Poribacteria bacterium]|nr:hypothetical protein [Candidatus Poribacteria bacterium]